MASELCGWRKALFLLGFLSLLILAGCGSSAINTGTVSSGSASFSQKVPVHSGNSAAGVSQGGSSSTNGGQANKTSQQTQASSPQYLIKTLKATLSVKDTRQVADDLQDWITSHDPQASSDGADYEQVGDNEYTVTITFAVAASKYDQVSRYLRSYTPQQGGKLLSFNETVQDVTNNYIDLQAQITNLNAEKQRILTIMQSAQQLSDVLTVEQKLTDVQQQIETDQAQLKELSGQTQFYNVTINLQPIDSPVPPAPTSSGWNFGQTLHDAFAASLTFGEGLVSFLVWLLAFCLYLIPILLIAWLVIRFRNQRPALPRLHIDPLHARPTPSTTVQPPVDEDTSHHS